MRRRKGGEGEEEKGRGTLAITSPSCLLTETCFEESCTFPLIKQSFKCNRVIKDFTCSKIILPVVQKVKLSKIAICNLPFLHNLALIIISHFIPLLRLSGYMHTLGFDSDLTSQPESSATLVHRPASNFTSTILQFSQKVTPCVALMKVKPLAYFLFTSYRAQQNINASYRVI